MAAAASAADRERPARTFCWCARPASGRLDAPPFDRRDRFSPPFVWGTIALEISPDCPIFIYTLLVSCQLESRWPRPGSAGIEVRREFRSQERAAPSPASEPLAAPRILIRRADGCVPRSAHQLCTVCSAFAARPQDRSRLRARRVAYLEMYNPANLHYSQSRCSISIVTSFNGSPVFPVVHSVAQPPAVRLAVSRVPVTPFDAAPPLPALREANACAGYSFVTPNYFYTLNFQSFAGRNSRCAKRGECQLSSSAKPPLAAFGPPKIPSASASRSARKRGPRPSPARRVPSWRAAKWNRRCPGMVAA